MPNNVLLARFNFSSNTHREEDVLNSNQSLRILSNLVAAGATRSSGLLDEIISELLDFTATIVSLKSSELNDLIAKVFTTTFYI